VRLQRCKKRSNSQSALCYCTNLVASFIHLQALTVDQMLPQFLSSRVYLSPMSGLFLHSVHRHENVVQTLFLSLTPPPPLWGSHHDIIMLVPDDKPCPLCGRRPTEGRLSDSFILFTQSSNQRRPHPPPREMHWAFHNQH